MNGVKVNFDDTHSFVDLTINPGKLDNELNAKSLYEQIINDGYGEVYISESSIKSACDTANHYYKTKDDSTIMERIGERRNAEVEFRIAEDSMSAVCILTAPFGGKLPTANTIKKIAHNNHIHRGIGMKKIRALLSQIEHAQPGTRVEGVIAKGLPPRDGRSSRFRPLVPNALDRILKPQTTEDNRVDMRNLGDVICVKAKTPVLRREPPTKGRSGFDVRGSKLEGKEGEWTDFKQGNGTEVSPQDNNLLLAAISGMPKYKDLTMNIDDTFICNGVNVGSGHVNYDGAVLVNGDVTEKMRIVASGDVTINGFVESAHIESGGDIIITEGAMGKTHEQQQDFSCHLIASGSVHLQHGQGIDIKCAGNVTVTRQLAYSKVNCGGGVIVGQIDNPLGNLFACEIVSQEKVVAGTLGAVSGSTLRIDFSPGFNQLQARKDTLDELLQNLRINNSRHKEKIALLKDKFIPSDIRDKFDSAVEMLKSETALLEWIEAKTQEMKLAKEQYQRDVKLIANKRLYSGVSVKLNNRHWRSEREYDRSMVKYEGHQWLLDPIMQAMS